MSTNITMPALSPTMEEGNLSKWLVKEGDTVSAGDVVAEIETDKATMEVEAVDEGIVAKILVAEGAEGVKVNAVIAVLAEEGEEVGDVTAAPQEALVNQEPSSVDTAKPAAQPTSASPALISQDKSEELTVSHEIDRVFATPLARRIAQQNDLDIALVAGSGPRGRIVKADVELALASGVQAAPQQENVASKSIASPSTGMADDTVLKMFAEGAFEKKPHDGMRKVIAERLSESSQSIPCYFITMECELDALLALRSQLNGAAHKGADDKPAFRLSVNDFIVKAMAMALKAVPTANVSWTSTDRLFHKHADVGVAVAVEDGLFTPIVRQAELKTLSTISAEVKDMAGRARSKRLKPEEYQGGCTAVSNLGMFGVKEFTSIINPPHASIVSVGAGEKRAVVKDDALAIATVMSATFAFDHRAIDGALGAELAAAFKGYIENPLTMVV